MALQFPGVLFPNADPSQNLLLSLMGQASSNNPNASNLSFDQPALSAPPVAQGQPSDFEVPMTPMPSMDAAVEQPIERKHTSFLKRPGMSSALAALGAGLLSGDSFGHGLAKGVQGYHSALQDEQDRRLPKLAADGSFAVTTDPTTGEQSFKRTPIADYQEGLVGAKFDRQKELAGINWGYKSQDRQDQRSWQSGENEKNRQSQAAMLAEQIAARREQARENAQLRRDMFNERMANRPLSAKVLKDYTDIEDDLGNTQQTISMVEPVMQMIQSGKLKLSLLDNYKNEAALAIGNPLGNEQTELYAQYKQAVEYVRNNFLALQKGVQTEGDAVRALNAIRTGSGYGPAVLKNLQVFLEGSKRAASRKEQQLDRYIDNTGIEDGSRPRRSSGGGSGAAKPRGAASPPAVGTVIVNKQTGQRMRRTATGWEEIK